MNTLAILLAFGASFAVSSDVCDLGFDPGPCKGMKNVVAFEDGKCVPKLYGGCRGNGNRFSSISDCETTCSSKLTSKFAPKNPLCLKPAVEGRRQCKGMFARFTFNADVGRCEEFVYGGCGGGENLFLSLTECVSVCMTEETPAPPPARARDDPPGSDGNICELPAVLPGPLGCLAFQTKWSYSKSEGGCVKKSYGGCGGTANLFDSREECEQTCDGLTSTSTSAEVCSLPLLPGPCKQFQLNYGFNSLTGRCEAFGYGGCAGNGNRFPSVEDCMATCGGSEPVLSISECSGVQCNNNKHKIQEAKGCKPVTQPGECCPSAWDCSAWERRLERLDQCWYSGQFYRPGEAIAAVTEDNSCSQACFCRAGLDGGSAEISCADVDCPYNPAFDWDTCRPVYQGFQDCCFNNFTCGPELEQRTTCQLDGTTYYEGELMYPQSDPCAVCHCRPGWDGDIGGEFCQQTKCSIRGAEERIVRGCQPVYQDNVCCPHDWICPDDISPNSPAITDAGPAIKAGDKCLLPKVVGPCKMFKSMFYFDTNSRSCQAFDYGGCRGNENLFSSAAECEETCQVFMTEDLQPLVRDLAPPSPPTSSVCSQPVTIGPCKSRLEKFYYDQESGVCQKFYFSGCRGGQNMFDTLADCRETCVQPQKLPRANDGLDLYVTDPCHQEKDDGPCRAAMPRWFFNKQSQSCEEFLYGGCQGNKNNFRSQNECQLQCMGEGSGRSGSLIDVSTLPAGVSRPSVTAPGRGGGCAGCPTSSIVTPDIKMVAARGVKKLASLAGGCNKIVLREISDVKTQVVAGTNYIFSMKIETRSGPGCDIKVARTCSDIYIYKPLGCDIAGNCLEVIREDEITCEAEDEEEVEVREEDPCLLEKSVGRCRGAFTRYHFHPETKTCRSFLYGGCQGNGNNFANERSCQQTCGKHMAPAMPSFKPTPKNEICQLPMEAGPCYALKPRFFFNFQSRRCEEFIYGGCRGNENNFQTMQECVSACGKHPRGLVTPVTALPGRPEPRCRFGNDTFALGDVIRLAGGDCQSCACLTPPDLTCSVTQCSLRAFLPPVGGVNCVMEKDSFGCCDVGYKCDSVAPPTPVRGGGYPVLGGYGSSEPIGPEQKKIAATATKKILTTVSGVTECGDLTLLEITHFSRQLVAGLNFRLSLKLRSRCGQNLVRLCENIVLYQPLPHQCTPAFNNNYCLTLSSPENIVCN